MTRSNRRSVNLTWAAACGAAVLVLLWAMPTPQAQEAGSKAATLDYEYFRTNVQPIFLAKREGHARCVACHIEGTPMRLQAMSPGATTWNEEQSRKNFELVRTRVVPGNPKISRLLIHPLANEGGGDLYHSGGKHWTSQSDPEWQTLAAWVRTRVGAAPAASGAKPGLSFETFKTRVQPILTSPRKGNARCSACHSRGGGNAYLEPLTPGSTTYTDEQSQRNFERIQRLVVPGEPTKSVLLMNPLATEAGGSHWHGGGKHWQSQDNPEWQTLAAWVRGS